MRLENTVKRVQIWAQERKFDAEQMAELLDRHDYKKLKEELESCSSCGHSGCLRRNWTKRSGSLCSGCWPRKRAAEVFTDMDSDMREDLINALTEFRAGRSPWKRCTWMIRWTSWRRCLQMWWTVLLMATDEDTRAKINALLQYPERQCGQYHEY